MARNVVETNQRLQIRLSSAFQYFDVEQKAYEVLMNAGSKGRHFLDNIEPFYA